MVSAWGCKTVGYFCKQNLWFIQKCGNASVREWHRERHLPDFTDAVKQVRTRSYFTFGVNDQIFFGLFFLLFDKSTILYLQLQSLQKSCILFHWKCADPYSFFISSVYENWDLGKSGNGNILKSGGLLGGIMNWSYFSTPVTTHESKFAQHVISWCLQTNTERVYVMHLFKQDLRNEQIDHS